MKRKTLMFDDEGRPIPGADVHESIRILQRMLFGICDSVYWNRVLLLAVLLLTSANLAVTLFLLFRQ